MFKQMAEVTLEYALSFAELLLELIWTAVVAFFHLLMLLGTIAFDFFHLLLTALQHALLQL